MKKWTFRQILKVLNNYVVFFLTVGFAVSCCMILFLNILADSMGLQFDASNIAVAAKLTFGNVLLITFLFGTADFIRRKITVDRPVKQITEAAEKIMQGDFSVRVPSIHGAGTEGFNEIGKAINKMAEELSGTETLRTDFVSNVSHELKAPLSVMQNLGTMLQSRELSEEQRLEYAKSITEQTRKLSALITNILKLNRLENQQIYPDRKEYNLTEQICECLLAFENAWEQKGLEIETDLEEDILITEDAELLSLVWNNLFSNAIKFTEAGGTVFVQVKKEQDEVRVLVKDEGCGISPEIGSHIFEKFYQGDTSHATQGNGLGLALVKRVIDIVGGDISVQSALGKGSTFTVTIKNGKIGSGL